jgi:hypothetical protein
MINRHCRAIESALRAVPAVALAMGLVTAGLAAPRPSFADSHFDPPFREATEIVDATTVPAEPVGRIQVVIRSVDVSNDRDGFWTGSGDIELTTAIWLCTGPNPPCSASDNNEAVILAEDKKSFSADSGDHETLNRVIPSADDVINANFASEFGGIAVFDGRSYLLDISAFEHDVSGGDFMGGVQRIINKDNNWGEGVYTREPAGHDPDTSLPGRGLLCAGCGDIIIGDYLVTYAIRFMSLPDMHPTAMTVKTPGGPDAEVCATIENEGTETAEAFGLIFTVDDKRISQIGGGVPAGQSKQICANVDPVAVGNHTLAVAVDPDRAIAESNERNNVYSTPYVRRVIDDVVGPVTGGVLETTGGSDTGQPPILRGTGAQGITQVTTTTTVQTAPGPRPSLKVNDIQVKGKQPSGQNDCDPGENDVTVVMKNEGAAAATNLVLQLVVDGKEKDALEKPVGNINANQSLNVTFDDVELKSDDEHKLLATLLTKKAGSEGGEELAKLEREVRCRNE